MSVRCVIRDGRHTRVKVKRVQLTMKSCSAAFVATLVLTVCAVDEIDWSLAAAAAADAASSQQQRTPALTLTNLRTAVRQIERLAEKVDDGLSFTGNSGGSAETTDWIPGYKRASGEVGKSGKRKSGRRRYDAYGVAGRFGRSVN